MIDPIEPSNFVVTLGVPAALCYWIVRDILTGKWKQSNGGNFNPSWQAACDARHKAIDNNISEIKNDIREIRRVLEESRLPAGRQARNS